jgi:hypothetical protein
MIFNPNDKKKIISNSFPNFKLAGHDLAFVSRFRYLGHIIDQSMIDEKDIMREIKAMFSPHLSIPAETTPLYISHSTPRVVSDGSGVISDGEWSDKCRVEWFRRRVE